MVKLSGDMEKFLQHTAGGGGDEPGMDPDWLNTFWDIAGKTSSTDMQELLAKVLAGEVRNPGSYQASTVLALSLLSRHQAKLFQRLCNMSFFDGTCARVILTLPDLDKANAAYNPVGSSRIMGRNLSDFGLDHPELLELNSARLLASMPKQEYPLYSDFYGPDAIEFAGRQVKIDASEYVAKWEKAEQGGPEVASRCNVISLTRTGLELRSILPLEPDENYTAALQRALKRAGASPIRLTVKTAPAYPKEAVKAKTRDTYKYQFKVGNKIVHGGITTDLDRREAEHQQKWPKGHIKPVGRRTTEDAARKWEKDKGYG